MGRRRARAQAHTGGERGATVVEYALGLAVVSLVMIGGAQVMERAAGEEVERKAEAGAPDLDEAYAPPIPTGSDDAGSGDEGTEERVAEAVSATMDGEPSPDGGNHWAATVTVRVAGSSGDGHSQAVVNGTWTGGGGSGASCVTGTDGTCVMALTKLNRNQVASVTFTTTGVTGDWVAEAELPEPVEVQKPQ